MNSYTIKISNLMLCLTLLSQSDISASDRNAKSQSVSFDIPSLGRRVAHYANYGLMGAAVALGGYFTYKTVTSPSNTYIPLDEPKTVAVAGVAVGGLFGYLRRGQVNRYEQAMAAQHKLQELQSQLPVLEEKAKTTDRIQEQLVNLQQRNEQQAQQHQESLQQAARVAASLGQELSAVKNAISEAQKTNWFIGIVGISAHTNALRSHNIQLRPFAKEDPEAVTQIELNKASIAILEHVKNNAQVLLSKGILSELDTETGKALSSFLGAHQ